METPLAANCGLPSGLSSNGKTGEWHSPDLVSTTSSSISKTAPTAVSIRPTQGTGYGEIYGRKCFTPSRNFPDTCKDVPSGITLSRAVESLLTAKRMGNCRPRYIESLRAYLKQFARDREEMLLDDFDVTTIEQWFANRTESLTTMASNVGRLSALFGFAVRREWIARNPVRQLERIRIERKAPFILNVDQARALMGYVVAKKPNEIAFFTFALFAGVRPEEIERITWQSIDLDRGMVTIDAAASKVRRRRIMDIEPNAIAFLKLAKAKGARIPVKKMTRRRYLDHAERLLGFNTWPQDSLRHSAASYLLAKHKNAGLVADRLGNSPSILLRYYRELVGPDDCAAFWAITP